jgi:polygalacturonase
VAQASPALIAMNKCSNITIDQFNLMNACGNVLSYIGCKNLTINGVIVKSTAVSGSQGMMFADCDGIKMTNAYFETSAAELSSAGTSKNVTVVNCKSATGKKLQATR